jgi:hypothetical protein
MIVTAMLKASNYAQSANQLWSERAGLGWLLFLALLQLFFPTRSAAQWIHLYNSGLDQAAQTIKTNYANISVAGIIDLQQTNLDAIASNELAAVKTMAIMQRDAAIFDVIQGTNLSSDFYKKVSERLDQLVTNFSGSITNTEFPGDLISISMLRLHFHEFNLASETFQTAYGVAPPPFQFAAEGPPDMVDWFKKHPSSRYPAHLGEATIYVADYTNLLADFKPVNQSGVLQDAAISLFTTESNLAKEETDSGIGTKAYNDALNTYSNAVSKANQESLSKIPTEVSNALVTVNKSLQSLAASGGAFGRLAAITNELADIDTIINASVSTNAPTEGAKIKDSSVAKAAVIASSLPGILDKSVSFAKALSQPPLTGLLIDRDILLVQKNMAQRAVERETQAVTLQEQHYLATLDEANLLSDILAKRNDIQAQCATNFSLTNTLTLPTVDALKRLSKTNLGTILQESLLEYAESIRVSEYHEMLAQYQLLDLYYTQANDASEGAAEMWNSLLSNPINTLGQYHSGGLKPEQIADVLSKFFIGAAILAK